MRGRDQYLRNAKSPLCFLLHKPPWFHVSERDHSASELFCAGSAPAVRCAQLRSQPVSKNAQEREGRAERAAGSSRTAPALINCT